MKRLAASIMMILLICSFFGCAAASDYDVLPWGMTWDISLREYVDVLQRHMPGTEYRILETNSSASKGVYYVEHRTEDGEQSISYMAVFAGESTANQTTEHQLEDIENKALNLDWMGIDFAPIGEGEQLQRLYQGDVMTAFEGLYNRFAVAFGQGDVDYSYITIQTALGDEGTSYVLPRKNGEIDFDSIRRHFVENIENIDTYWLLIGDGHASCRLYVTSLTNPPDGSEGKMWRSSNYFTREPQKSIPRNAMVLP